MRPQKQQQDRFPRLLLAVGILGLLLALWGLLVLVGPDREPEPPVDAVSGTSVAQKMETPAEKPATSTGTESEKAETATARKDTLWGREKLSGDYPEMIKRRFIRALVPLSKTFFFIDRGKKQGLIYDALMAFEKEINRELKNRHVLVKVVVIPTARDRLISDLLAGYGEIAAGNLTITPERSKLVDFAAPILTGVDEIIVVGPGVEAPANIFDLAGREVFVRKSSSYYESLQQLNATLVSVGKEPVHVRAADEYLEDEDLLEMVDAGLIPMIVIDSHKAALWEKVFDHIRVIPDVRLRTGGRISWAVRKDSPELRAVVSRFMRTHRKGTLNGNLLYRRYLEKTGYLRDNLNRKDRKRYEQTIDLFKKYAGQYDFPYLLITALAFQESGLDHSRRSRAGAVGIMQILPRTAADKNVGISHIELLENNIHAGVRYLHFLKTRYFSNPELDTLNANLFTLAAYNAGPARIAALRREAARQGLDPDVWFNNVEIIAARRIGGETVRYVANIYKLYIAYRRIVAQETKKKVGKTILQQHYMGL